MSLWENVLCQKWPYGLEYLRLLLFLPPRNHFWGRTFLIQDIFYNIPLASKLCLIKKLHTKNSELRKADCSTDDKDVRKQRVCGNGSYLVLSVLLLWFKFSHSSVHEVYEVLRDYSETKNLFPRVRPEKGWATNSTAIYRTRTNAGGKKYDLSLVWMFRDPEAVLIIDLY